jgi:predicted DNA-binding transcriptional regulator YafY
VRASRLVALLLHLQQRPEATAAELAGLLEVSVRTIYRDVAALQAAGVPLWTEPGPRGGIRLLEGWRTNLDGLTADEAGVLFLSGAPGAAAELGLGTMLAAAQVKVLATLPPELRARAGRIQERFHLDAPGWFHRDGPPEHLALLADACWSDRRVDVRYRRSDREVTRRVDPLGLVCKAGTWYLVARHRGDLRTYRVSRVVGATAREERFERPAGFDLAATWRELSHEFDRSLLRATVRIRCSRLGVRLLPHFVDDAAARDAIAAAGEPDVDGWRELVLAVESEEVAASQLIALGAEVEVLEPLSLRAALAATGAAIARRNAGRTTRRRSLREAAEPAQ